MKQWVAFGLVLLATQCIASFEPPREVERKLDATLTEVFFDAPWELQSSDVNTENNFQDVSDAPLRSFWEALEEEAYEFHEASDDDLEEFHWSDTSDVNDNDDDEDGFMDDAIDSELMLQRMENLDDLFIEGLPVEDRINFKAIGGWIKKRAQQVGATAKTVFVKLGGKKVLEHGLNLIKALKVRIDPINCANISCGSCIYVDVAPLNGHKACVRFGMLDKLKIGALVRLNEKILFEGSVDLSSAKALCPPLPFPLGSICLQSIQVSKNGTDMGYCMVVVIKQFKVGGQLCAKLEGGRLKPTFKAMRIPAEEKFNILFVLDENNKVEEVTSEVDIATHTSVSETAVAESENDAATNSRR